jgi:hypothetical protein
MPDPWERNPRGPVKSRCGNRRRAVEFLDIQWRVVPPQRRIWTGWPTWMAKVRVARDPGVIRMRAELERFTGGSEHGSLDPLITFLASTSIGDTGKYRSGARTDSVRLVSSNDDAEELPCANLPYRLA